MDKIQEIRERAAAATPGRWHWTGNTQSKQIELTSTTRGRPTVMAFFRWGMRDAKPSFNSERGLLDLEDHVIYQVAPGAKRGDPKLYREDFFEIDHPDAQFIAHARDDVDTLLEELDSAYNLLDLREAEVRDLDRLAMTQAISISILERKIKRLEGGS